MALSYLLHLCPPTPTQNLRFGRIDLISQKIGLPRKDSSHLRAPSGITHLMGTL